MNLKPAPFWLTPHRVKALLGTPYYGADVCRVPVLSIKLVDQPRASVDPRLAKANDNGGDHG